MRYYLGIFLIIAMTLAQSPCPKCADPPVRLNFSLTPYHIEYDLNDLPTTLELRYVWRIHYSSGTEIAIRNCDEVIGTITIGANTYELIPSSSTGVNYIDVSIPVLSDGIYSFPIHNPCSSTYHYLGSLWALETKVSGINETIGEDEDYGISFFQGNNQIIVENNAIHAVELELYSITGEKIINIPNFIGKEIIDLENFTSGIYFFRAKLNGRIICKKITAIIK